MNKQGAHGYYKMSTTQVKLNERSMIKLHVPFK